MAEENWRSPERRHRDALAHALKALRAKAKALKSMAPEIIELSYPLRGGALGQITGEVHTERLLDAVPRTSASGSALLGFEAEEKNNLRFGRGRRATTRATMVPREEFPLSQNRCGRSRTPLPESRERKV